jgi:hypothetical protein
MRERTGACKVSEGKPEGRFGRPRLGREDNIKISQEIGWRAWTGLV